MKKREVIAATPKPSPPVGDECPNCGARRMIVITPEAQKCPGCKHKEVDF